MSDARLAGGLPVLESDVPESDGEREYWRALADIEGIFIGEDVMM